MRNVDNFGIVGKTGLSNDGAVGRLWHVGGGGRGWGVVKVSPKPSMMAEALSILTGTILGQHPTITNNYLCAGSGNINYYHINTIISSTY